MLYFCNIYFTTVKVKNFFFLVDLSPANACAGLHVRQSRHPAAVLLGRHCKLENGPRAASTLINMPDTVGIYICSMLCNVWPRKSFLPLILGTFIETVGIMVLVWALHVAHDPTIFGIMGLVGVGSGIRYMIAPMHGIGLFKAHRSTIIGLMAVAVPLGGTVGLTVMSALFNNTSGLEYKDHESIALRAAIPSSVNDGKDKAKVSPKLPHDGTAAEHICRRASYGHLLALCHFCFW